MSPRFWKLSGAGNDFVLVERKSLRGSPRALAKALCARKEGIGADGLLVVSSGRVPRLDYYNSDGSEAFCGNGLRCASFWLMKWRKAASASMRTNEGLFHARFAAPGRVAVSMPAPSAVRAAAWKGKRVFLVNTGVPHAVVFVPSVETAPLKTLGPALRKKFNANVNFVARRGRRLAIRTFERGVEGETLACGTGAAAAAVAAWHLKKARPPVRLKARGGDLTAAFTPTNGRAAGLRLEGPARLVFTGELP